MPAILLKHCFNVEESAAAELALHMMVVAPVRPVVYSDCMDSPECLHGQTGGRHATEASKSPYGQVDCTEDAKSVSGPCSAACSVCMCVCKSHLGFHEQQTIDIHWH